MSEKRKRKIHGSECKARIGLEAVRGAKSINEIGQEYGVYPVQVGQYKKRILEQAGQLFEGKRGLLVLTEGFILDRRQARQSCLRAVYERKQPLISGCCGA